MNRVLDIESRGEGAAHRLALRGELDLTSAEELTNTVAALCERGAGEIVLDVCRLTFIDSTGLRAILNSKALCEESLCEFALTPGEDEVSEQLHRLFEITGLLGRLPFRSSGSG